MSAREVRAQLAMLAVDLIVIIGALVGFCLVVAR